MSEQRCVDDRQEFWRDYLSRHDTEGGAVRHYCERRGLSSKTFRAWRKRLRPVVAEETASGGSEDHPRPSSGAVLMPLHVELLTNMRPRRSWSPEQKQQIVLDPVRSGLSVEPSARQHGMTPSVVHS